jgi:two-component system response regulator AtoC
VPQASGEGRPPAGLQWSVATPPTPQNESTLAGSQAGGATGLHLLVMGPTQFATFALPVRGEVIVGRGSGDGVDVKLDDARASRRHLRLHIADAIEVEDLGSANGTRIHERKLAARTRVRILPGEAISVGALVLMVQSNGSVPVQRRGRPISEAELEQRIEWECARAEATGGTFSLARVPAPPDAAPPDVAYGTIRMIDVVGRCGPRAVALLMPGLAGETAYGVATAFAQRLGSGPPRIRVVSYPGDGRHAGALLARMRADDTDGAGPWPIASVEASMLRVQALADRAAAGNINVLILGESGTGKEVLAQAIHAASARASRPLVPINCAALAPSLFESELFGHERGAFTGAAQAKPGLLETAPGGTVFLDEIGETPPEAQAKLLRVIETREVLRVGGVRPRKIDVRFIFATNRDLGADVASGRFRRDLYFRLNGMTLTIPPLRERPADIPVLARGLLPRTMVEPPLRKPPPELSEAAMAVLRAHGWPGNVRELKQWIERALLLCEGPMLLPEHFPAPEPVVASVPPAAPPQMGGDERARILAALAACGGNQSRAARELGISRKVLLARLDRYKVTRPRKPGPK